jgi:hypothetical protein
MHPKIFGYAAFPPHASDQREPSTSVLACATVIYGIAVLAMILDLAGFVGPARPPAGPSPAFGLSYTSTAKHAQDATKPVRSHQDHAVGRVEAVTGE